jgi:hypothetical protein
MISKVKFLESAFCSKSFFPMLHSVSLFATYYIGRFYFSSAEVDLSNLKQNESLMRIKSQVSNKSMQRVKLHDIVSHALSSVNIAINLPLLDGVAFNLC